MGMAERKVTCKFTDDNLKVYQKAALANAVSLVAEARLLRENSFHARCYFLSISAIEEIGKAIILFQSRGRNLESQSIQSRIKKDIQDHSAKINAAFHPFFWGATPKKIRSSLDRILSYMIALNHGREPAMYSEIDGRGLAQQPSQIVRPKAASDCLKLAIECLQRTEKWLQSQQPKQMDSLSDKIYSLGSKVSKVWNEDNFGVFLLGTIPKNNIPDDFLSKAVIKYYEEYLCKGIKFAEKSK